MLQIDLILIHNTPKAW